MDNQFSGLTGQLETRHGDCRDESCASPFQDSVGFGALFQFLRHRLISVTIFVLDHEDCRRRNVVDLAIDCISSGRFLPRLDGCRKYGSAKLTCRQSIHYQQNVPVSSTTFFANHSLQANTPVLLMYCIARSLNHSRSPDQICTKGMDRTGSQQYTVRDAGNLLVWQ